MKRKFIIFIVLSTIVILSRIIVDGPIRTIFEISATLGVIGFFVYLIKGSNKLRIELNKAEEENPEKKEFYRITKSKAFGTAEKNDRTRIIPIIIVLIIIILAAYVMFLAYEHNVDNNIIFYSSTAFACLLLSFLFLKSIIKKRNYIKYAYRLLSNKYGPVQKQPKIPKKIIYGKKSEVGNIRNNYLFSYKILKYKCILTSFSQEELVKELSSSVEHTYYRYRYKPLKKIFEYKYNLNVLGAKNISVDILENQNIKDIINELSKIKLFNNITINENYLIIEKETVFGYTREDLNRDIDDVELFYNKIVKIVLESE